MKRLKFGHFFYHYLDSDENFTKTNPNLDQYAGKIMFPEKLAKANEILKRVGLPNQIFKKG
jgi:hypothetical protein